tara:strand:- start:103 stop:276 length:174 start_codon:yes stop_codon:yes gene_type:complete
MFALFLRATGVPDRWMILLDSRFCFNFQRVSLGDVIVWAWCVKALAKSLMHFGIILA